MAKGSTYPQASDAVNASLLGVQGGQTKQFPASLLEGLPGVSVKCSVWDSSTLYHEGVPNQDTYLDLVTFNGSTYYCKQTNQNKQPDTNPSFWGISAAKGTGGVDYSTSETDTGLKWIDGKKIYRKVVNFGTLPNATTKSVAHGVANIAQMLTPKAFAQNPGVSMAPIPNTDPSGILYANKIVIDNANINIITGVDRTAFTICYVTLEYTCTDR